MAKVKVSEKAMKDITEIGEYHSESTAQKTN